MFYAIIDSIKDRKKTGAEQGIQINKEAECVSNGFEEEHSSICRS